MTRGQIHLTEDEMAEALMGTASPSCAAHLQACAECAAGFADFNSTMTNFNQASAAWSEAKSNALSRDLKQHRTPIRLTSAAIWSFASVLVLVIVVMLGLRIHQRAEQNSTSEATLRRSHVQSSNSEDASRSEIASDDAMLRQIDAAIDTAEPSPEALYGVPSNTAGIRETSSQTQVRN